MHTYKDSRYRSVIKAITFRIIATIATMIIVFVLTRFLEIPIDKAVKVSFIAGAADGISKLILYYFHERLWGLISLGKKTHPLSDLPVNRPLNKEDMEIIKNKLKDLGYLSED